MNKSLGAHLHHFPHTSFSSFAHHSHIPHTPFSSFVRWLFITVSSPDHPLTPTFHQTFIDRFIDCSWAFHHWFIDYSLFLHDPSFHLHHRFIPWPPPHARFFIWLYISWLASHTRWHGVPYNSLCFLLVLLILIWRRDYFFWSLGSILIIFHQNSHVGTIFGTDLRELKSWKNLMIQTPFTPHMISTHYYFPIYLVLCPLLLFLTFPLALTLVPCLLPFTLSLVLYLTPLLCPSNFSF